MILYLTILLLALLVPVIIKIDGIDQPTQAYRRSYSTGGKGYDNFVLARGQPNTRASIIKHQNTLPRNKGKPP